MTDVFGNYVIQKFFEFGTPEQKATLAQKVNMTELGEGAKKKERKIIILIQSINLTQYNKMIPVSFCEIVIYFILVYLYVGSWSRTTAGVADVRLSCHTKGFRIHFWRTTSRNSKRIGRSRFEMYKRSEW